MRRLPIAIAVAAASVVLAACGSTDNAEPAGSGTAAQASSATAVSGTGATEPGADAVAADGAHNDADVTFLQGMIPHHEQAVEMAVIALEPGVGASAEVTGLARTIRDAQDPEIEQMRGLLEEWGESEMEEMADGHAGMEGMDGMMSADEMAGLEGMSGAAFNRTWLEMMTRHHEGAIETAKQVKTEGASVVVKALADTIIRAQQAEIEQMRGLLESS